MSVSSKAYDFEPRGLRRLRKVGRERELEDLGFRASWALRTIIKRGSHDEGPNEDHDGDLTRRP